MPLSSAVTGLTAFGAGILSFLSPCVLPLVPLYLSYMSGASIEEIMEARGSEALKHTGLKSISFVLGLSVVFVSMGATATSLGQLLLDRQHILMQVAGAVIIILGLQMAGLFKIRALYTEKRFRMRTNRVGVAGAFLMGILFALGWTPCTSAQLGAILALAADRETVLQGIGLLTAYSLGLGIPFIITGFATGTVLKALAGVKRHFRKIEIASGALMVAIGVLILTGGLQHISSRLTDWLPAM